MRAKNLNRIMRVVWPMVSRPLGSNRKKAAKESVANNLGSSTLNATGVAPLTMEGSGDSVEVAEEALAFESELATTVGEEGSDAEGLNLCGLLEEAVEKGVVVDLSGFLGSQSSLASGILDLDLTGALATYLRREYPGCRPRICCSSCHSDHLIASERESDDSTPAACDLLGSAVQEKIEINFGRLLLGPGDVLDIDHVGNTKLVQLRDVYPSCQLCICCVSCHWNRNSAGHPDIFCQNEEESGLDNDPLTACNDCCIVDGEVFHEDGCSASS